MYALSEFATSFLRRLARSHRWQIDVMPQPIKLNKDMFRPLTSSVARQVGKTRYLDARYVLEDVAEEGKGKGTGIAVRSKPGGRPAVPQKR